MWIETEASSIINLNHVKAVEKYQDSKGYNILFTMDYGISISLNLSSIPEHRYQLMFDKIKDSIFSSTNLSYDVIKRAAKL